MSVLATIIKLLLQQNYHFKAASVLCAQEKIGNDKAHGCYVLKYTGYPAWC